MSSRPSIRLYVDNALTGKDEVIALSKEQSHYVLQVMRQKEGAELGVFNGEHGEWRAVVQLAGNKKVELRLAEKLRSQQAEPDIWLAFAPIKFGKIDFLVQKATELGVSKLLPVQTDHTIVERVKTERLLANAVEAAEQSERLTVPAVEGYQRFQRLLDEWPQDRLLIMADETGGGLPPAELLPALTGQKLAVIIGPEGGFSAREVQQLRMQPYVKQMSLGPRILRADTAALAALTCLQVFIGDWREGIPHFETKD